MVWTHHMSKHALSYHSVRCSNRVILPVLIERLPRKCPRHLQRGNCDKKVFVPCMQSWLGTVSHNFHNAKWCFESWQQQQQKAPPCWWVLGGENGVSYHLQFISVKIPVKRQKTWNKRRLVSCWMQRRVDLTIYTSGRQCSMIPANGIYYTYDWGPFAGGRKLTERRKLTVIKNLWKDLKC